VPARSPRTLPLAALVVALALPLAAPAAAAAAVPTGTTPSPQPSVGADAESAEAPRGVDLDTQFFLTIARSTVASAAGKVDVTELEGRIAHLDDPAALSVAGVAASLTALRESTAEVAEARNAYDAAAARAAAAAAEAAQSAAALAQANTPDGARATARQMASDRFGWGEDQFSCLNSLWQKESGWDYRAYNAGGGATGIPQALPGSKMASAGSDWQTVAATQISWGLGYIADVYGTPCSAWGHSQAVNWY
jgi:hypothetical protein